MRVMLTGATGFVGGHTMKALLAAGHEVRALIRDPSKLASALELHGIDDGRVDPVVGDILERATVDAALDGCGACVHTAAFTSLNEAEMPKALGVNAPGARNVLDAAVAAGCDPVIHVSTMSVIFPPDGDRLSADDPVKGGGAPYNASKADADLHARGLQDEGHPVVIVYPAGCTGPDDLGANVMETVLTQVLTSPVFMTADTGGSLLVDVRDVAAAIAALVEAGPRPARYMMGGTFLPWPDYAALVERVTGVARTLIKVTRAELEQAFDKEAVDMMLGLVPSDDDALHRDTGVEWRPVDETLRDTIRWMVGQGRLDAQHAAGAS